MFLLYDIGGTNMRLAVSKDGKTFGTPHIVLTPKNFEEGIQTFVKIARQLAGDEKIIIVAGGIAGTLDKEKKMLISSPNISGWIGEPFVETLQEMFDCPVYCENDAAIVGLGEATVGAGKDYLIVAYITVSTGIGGARIVNKKIDPSSYGFEPGHQIIDISYSNPDKGMVPNLEDVASGAALLKHYGKKPREIKDKEVWEDLADKLAYGLHNSIVHWSPDVVVLGGPMITGTPAVSIDRIEFHLKNILKVYPEIPVLAKATLGEVGGLWGALQYIINIKSRV